MNPLEARQKILEAKAAQKGINGITTAEEEELRALGLATKATLPAFLKDIQGVELVSLMAQVDTVVDALTPKRT